ncbi:class I SAM-dependent methyltransferase [Pseudomonas sp. Marseille-QA0892]
MNREAYNRIAAQWREARCGFYGREQAYLDMLLEPLAPGATVLDLGCGNGSPMAAYVVASGHRVIGVDQADAQLAFAREALPEQVWVLSSMEDYRFEHAYDAVILWDSLFHIERTAHEGILARAVGGLPHGGRLMLTVGGSAHPAFTDTLFGESVFYDSNTPEETRAILEGLGCRVLLGEFMNLPTDGRDKGRYMYVVEKAK